MVEGRLRPSPASDETPGAMSENVDVRASYGGDHAARHRLRLHREFRVHARHDDIEAGQQFLFLIERAVLQDVDLDPA
jgi:hypothetical protein